MRIILVGSIAITVVSLSSAYSTTVRAEAAAETERPVGNSLSVPPSKPGRARPLIVVVGENAGAETTDFVIPYGVLKDSGVAEVRSLSTGAGPAQLLRALRITADETIAEFDAAEPRGADIVIIPAQAAPKDPALITWVRSQAARGAVLVSVCEGARVLAEAGLLEGKRATTHWSALPELDKAYPRTTWVRDRRYVQDGAIISTAGVTASLPMSLALVEAIGGHAVAQATAERLGAKSWTATHRTADYHLDRGDFLRAVGAYLAFWTHETIELPVTSGIDEIALALRSDAWARSYRARVVTTSPSQQPVTSKHGLRILPDEAPRAGRFVIPAGRGSTVAQLEDAIDGMAQRYGAAARRFAVTGLEYDFASAGR